MQTTADCVLLAQQSMKNITLAPKAQGASEKKGQKMVKARRLGNLLRDCLLEMQGGLTHDTQQYGS